MSEVTEKIAASLDPKALAEFGQFEGIAVDLAMKACQMTELPEPIGDPHGERCSGLMICERCGRSYNHHPADWRVIGYGDVPYLNILCDGRRVKL